MVVALEAHVVRGVEVKEQELDRERERAEGVDEATGEVEVEHASVLEHGHGRVHEQEEGDCRVLEVVEVLRGDGEVGARDEGVVLVRENEELGRDREERTRDDEVELGAPAGMSGRCGREPRPGHKIPITLSPVGLDCVEKVPKTYEHKPYPRCHMAYQGAHS